MQQDSSFEGLPYWHKYETDPSFRRWVDGGEHAPDYTFARFLKTLARRSESVESSAVA